MTERKPRRRRGEGSVSSYQTKGGRRHRITWDEVDDQTGKRIRQRSKGGFITEKDAARELRSVLTSIEKGTYRRPTAITVGAFIDEWIDGLRLAESTVAGYRKLARLHVKPHIGDVALDKVRATTLAKLYRELETSGRRDAGHEGEGLGPNTVLKVHTLIGTMLQAAVDDNLLAANPARSKAANPPSLQQVRTAKAEISPWTADELNVFLSWSSRHGSDLHPAWVVAARTGVRRGELIALQWGDVDLDAGTLAVRRSATLVKEPGKEVLVLKLPKNGRPRVVDIDQPTIAALRAWRLKLSELNVARASRGAYVFGRIDNGEIRHPERTSRRFRSELMQAQREVGVDRLRTIHLHSLRHTHATLLLQAGVQPKVVQERLGHQTIAITMDLYSHVMPTVQKAAVEAFETLLG